MRIRDRLSRLFFGVDPKPECCLSGSHPPVKARPQAWASDLVTGPFGDQAWRRPCVETPCAPLCGLLPHPVAPGTGEGPSARQTAVRTGYRSISVEGDCQC